VSMTGDVGIISRSTLVHGLDLNLNWQIVGVGDLDGDGKADLVWRNNHSGDVAEWLMDGATLKSCDDRLGSRLILAGCRNSTKGELSAAAFVA